MEERTLSAEELKAKEYVDFYYFWLFNYCGRNFQKEIELRGLECASENYKEFKQKEEAARTIYWGHPLRNIYPQIADYEDPTGVIDDLYSFVGDATRYKPSTILESLYDGVPLGRGARKAQGGGVKILGTDRAHVSTDGHLRGYVIARIDLLAPIDSVIFELSKLKETKFESFPDFLSCPVGGEPPQDTGNYIHQKDFIKRNTQASFAVKDDEARAIGLWFWDVIDGPKAIFKNFAEAWKVTQGEKVPDILVGDEIPDGRSFPTEEEIKSISTEIDALFKELGEQLSAARKHEEKEKNKWEGVFYEAINKDQASNKFKIVFKVPSRTVFTKFGYSVSDPSRIRTLYRNTKKCIEACEVLSLK